jgi:transglutaminase-like putative cysteine protease
MQRPQELTARLVSATWQLNFDEKPGSRDPGPKVDFTDLHAWAEVTPGAGWIGLDPTSARSPARPHPLAATRIRSAPRR